MKNLSLILRYKLWKKEVPKYNWEETVSEWLSCSQERARDFLLNEITTVSDVEEKIILDGLDKFTDGLLILDKNYDLIGEISHANLNYLTQSNLGHGEKKLMAKALGVETTTVSRWISGKRKPSKSDLSKISKFFSVDASVDLETYPLFLSYKHWGYIEMQQWLKKKSETVNKDLLVPLFPALRKLLT